MGVKQLPCTPSIGLSYPGSRGVEGETNPNLDPFWRYWLCQETLRDKGK